MPVPVINTALKIDMGMASRKAEVEDGEGEEGITLPQSKENERKGCLVLRHYYLGAARIKCLESAITSVPVALREVGVLGSW